MTTVATEGFQVPPVPNAPTPAPVAPAPTPAAPAQGFTQADLDAAVAAALAAQQAPAAPVIPAAPGAYNVAEERGNDAVLDSFTTAFEAIGAGVDINRAIGNAVALGRPDLIDAAYLAEKGGAQAAQLQTIAKAIVERVQAQSKAAADAVYKTAGGQEQWTAASAVFNQQAPAHLKAVVAGLLESGNPEGIASGAQYVLDYARGQGLVPQPAQLVQAGASMPGAQALDKFAFQEALFKLDLNSRTFEADRNALFARRQLGKQIGK